jgi:hypothetical protein
VYLTPDHGNDLLLHDLRLDDRGPAERSGGRAKHVRERDMVAVGRTDHGP